MTCNVQTLLSANPCLYAMNPWQLKVVRVQMMCGLYNFLLSATAVTCDIQELLNDAACFNGLSMFQLDVVETNLLCNIALLIESGGGPAWHDPETDDPWIDPETGLPWAPPPE